MSVNDDLRQAEEDRLARLEAQKGISPTNYDYYLTQVEKAKQRSEEKRLAQEEANKNKPKEKSNYDVWLDKVAESTYERALEAVRNAKTDAEAAEAAAYVRTLAVSMEKDKALQGPQVADSADEKAKNDYLTNSITATPDDALDQRRWKNAFTPGEGDYLVYKDPKLGESDPNTLVPVSFMANKSGNIYQSKDARPESLNSAVARIANEYQNSGKLNELRDLFIANKFITDPEQIKYLQAMKEASPNYADAGTRALIETAVNYTSRLNSSIANAPTYGKRTFSTFEDFVKSYKGQFNIDNGNGNGSSGLPRRTVDINKKTFTPEELELQIDAFFQEYTGQGASEEDVKYLAKRFNEQAPQKTVSIRKGNTVTSTTTGGLDQAEQQLMMREMALKDPEAESYNKATTYLDYFRESLASPIELG